MDKIKNLVITLVAFIFVANLGLALETNAKKRIFDGAGVLTQKEKQHINQLLDKISVKDNAEYIIVTSSNHKEDDPAVMGINFIERYADNMYGKYANRHRDGAILAMCTKCREMNITTYGKVRVKHANQLDRLRMRIMEPMKSNNYAEAFDLFTKLLSLPTFSRVFVENIGFSLLISIFVSIVIVIYLLSRHKGIITVNHITYEQAGAFDLVSSRDRYLRTTRTKTRINKSGSSRGGGGRSSGSSSGRF